MILIIFYFYLIYYCIFLDPTHLAWRFHFIYFLLFFRLICFLIIFLSQSSTFTIVAGARGLNVNWSLMTGFWIAIRLHKSIVNIFTIVVRQKAVNMFKPQHAIPSDRNCRRHCCGSGGASTRERIPSRFPWRDCLCRALICTPTSTINDHLMIINCSRTNRLCYEVLAI